ncbi:hypothetical protein CYMTET_22208 [Cymbomonas tetramitiformis]|uniref:Uncharacterized protein n=1 Tax=Cymbomonas tetramitiformis TaxID=36881 RepID=A0AAE0L2I3_9CHLO|nr:hypothetical protein CYMTET_22208 [Cymbomonas tetramitiformis]
MTVPESFSSNELASEPEILPFSWRCAQFIKTCGDGVAEWSDVYKIGDAIKEEEQKVGVLLNFEKYQASLRKKKNCSARLRALESFRASLNKCDYPLWVEWFFKKTLVFGEHLHVSTVLSITDAVESIRVLYDQWKAETLRADAVASTKVFNEGFAESEVGDLRSYGDSFLKNVTMPCWEHSAKLVNSEARVSVNEVNFSESHFRCPAVRKMYSRAPVHIHFRQLRLLNDYLKNFDKRRASFNAVFDMYLKIICAVRSLECTFGMCILDNIRNVKGNRVDFYLGEATSRTRSGLWDCASEMVPPEALRCEMLARAWSVAAIDNHEPKVIRCLAESRKKSIELLSGWIVSGTHL